MKIKVVTEPFQPGDEEEFTRLSGSSEVLSTETDNLKAELRRLKRIEKETGKEQTLVIRVRYRE